MSSEFEKNFQNDKIWRSCTLVLHKIKILNRMNTVDQPLKIKVSEMAQLHLS